MKKNQKKYFLNSKVKKILSRDKSVLKTKRRELQKLSGSKANLYGFIAVLLVLIPEWLAEVAIILRESITHYEIPNKGIAWQTEPELRLASLSLVQLRKLAKASGLPGYASENRCTLTKRLLVKLNKKKKFKQPF